MGTRSARQQVLLVLLALVQGGAVAWAETEVSHPVGAPTPIQVQGRGVSCPAKIEVEDALRQVLGDEERSSGWVLSYGSSKIGTETVWMELVNPSGQSISWRQFPNENTDCRAVAHAMAAVVERALHSLGWTRGEPLPEAPPPARPETTVIPMATRQPRLLFGMGPVLGSSARLGLNLLAHAQLRFAGPVSLRLGGSLLASQDEQLLGPDGTGKASVQSRHLTAALLASLPKGRWHLDTGVVLLVNIDQGKTEEIVNQDTGWRASFAAGMLVGAGLRLFSRLRLGLDLQGLHAVSAPDFMVEIAGQKTVVLRPPVWQAIVLLKIEFLAWQ
jgi:hypothetical protein